MAVEKVGHFTGHARFDVLPIVPRKVKVLGSTTKDFTDWVRRRWNQTDKTVIFKNMDFLAWLYVMLFPDTGWNDDLSFRQYFDTFHVVLPVKV